MAYVRWEEGGEICVEEKDLVNGVHLDRVDSQDLLFAQQRRAEQGQVVLVQITRGNGDDDMLSLE